MTDERKDEPLVDADDFVGEPPAGDANLDDFVSDDQSADRAEEQSDGQSDDESEDES